MASDWADFEEVFDQAYNWRVSDYVVINGFTSPTGNEVPDLGDTLLYSGIPGVAEIESEFVSPVYVSGSVIQFSGKHAPVIGGDIATRIELVLEGEALRYSTNNLKDIRGQVYIFNQDSSQWQQLAFNDFSDGSYGFYAPKETSRPFDSEFEGTFRSMRRTTSFTLGKIEDFIYNSGTSGDPVWSFDIKIIHTGSTSFNTRLDLVQAVLIPTVVSEEEDEDEGQGRSGSGYMGAMQGSDMNYDQGIGEEDVSAFATKFFAQSPAADLNNDGHVDEVDLQQFIEGLE